MTRWILPALLMSVAGCDEPARTHAAPAAITKLVPVSARVVGVTDGDSLSVVLHGVQTKVRLEGIDAPEKAQDYGAAAKKVLAGIVSGREVEIVQTGTDRYRRTLARVYVGGADVSLAMLRAGMAWHFVRYNKDADLAAAEREARKARRGLWSKPAPVPPWGWRKEKQQVETAPGGQE